MINTLEMFEELKAASLTESQSRAIVRAVQVGLESQISNLATKQELQSAFQELKNDIQSLRREFQQETTLARQNLEQETTAIRLTIEREIQKASIDLEMRLVKYIFAQGVVVIGTVITVLHFFK